MTGRRGGGMGPLYNLNYGGWILNFCFYFMSLMPKYTVRCQNSLAPINPLMSLKNGISVNIMVVIIPRQNPQNNLKRLIFNYETMSAIGILISYLIKSLSGNL